MTLLTVDAIEASDGVAWGVLSDWTASSDDNRSRFGGVIVGMLCGGS